MMVARMTPHCLKQNGMARILTPEVTVNSDELSLSSQTYDGVGKSYGGSDGHGADKGGGRKEQLLNRGGTMPPSSSEKLLHHVMRI